MVVSRSETYRKGMSWRYLMVMYLTVVSHDEFLYVIEVCHSEYLIVVSHRKRVQHSIAFVSHQSISLQVGHGCISSKYVIASWSWLYLIELSHDEFLHVTEVSLVRYLIKVSHHVLDIVISH